MRPHRFRGGEPVIYSLGKHGLRPGPRARGVFPAPNGEDYTYYVDKFWTVVEELPDGRLVVLTRRGKHHVVRRDDPRLRRPSLWERLWFASRFPRPAEAGSELVRLEVHSRRSELPQGGPHNEEAARSVVGPG